MTEYVSKEAVLELLCRECTENCTGGTPYRCYVPCAEWKLIQALTAADVKPVVRGKWVWNPDKRCWECDQCGETTTDACMGKPRANCCPWCGADMRGEKHEDN